MLAKRKSATTTTNIYQINLPAASTDNLLAGALGPAALGDALGNDLTLQINVPPLSGKRGALAILHAHLRHTVITHFVI